MILASYSGICGSKLPRANLCTFHGIGPIHTHVPTRWTVYCSHFTFYFNLKIQNQVSLTYINHLTSLVHKAYWDPYVLSMHFMVLEQAFLYCCRCNIELKKIFSKVWIYFQFLLSGKHLQLLVKCIISLPQNVYMVPILILDRKQPEMCRNFLWCVMDVTNFHMQCMSRVKINIFMDLKQILLTLRNIGRCNTVAHAFTI